MGALILFSVVRFGTIDAVPWQAVLALGAVSAGLHVILAAVVRLHQGRAALGTLEEMLLLLGGVTATVGGVVTVGHVVSGSALGRSVPVGATSLDLQTVRELDPWAHPSEIAKVLHAMCRDLAMGSKRMIA